MKAIVIMIMGLLWCVFEVDAQFNYRGRIIDQTTAKPIAGAMVRIDKTMTVLSDETGYFSLSLGTKADSIFISHAAYQAIRVPLLRSENAQYELTAKNETLQEVEILNTGYQTIPRERATGSFVQLEGTTLQQQAGPNFMQRLGSVTNGLAPVAANLSFFGQNALLVRGMSSYTAGLNKPLVIVDNFEYVGDLNNLNPNEVESVTVLKDAAAASIWGAKAANGVIVITTKRSKKNQKMQINANINLSLTQEPDLKRIPAMSSSDMVNFEQYLFNQRYRFADTSRNTRPPFSPVYELLFAQGKGQVSPAMVQAQLAAWSNHDVRDDFQKYFYGKGVNQQYAVDLGSGEGTMVWSLNLSNDRTKGLLGEENNRYTIHWNNRLSPVKWISVNLGLNGVVNDGKSGAPAYGQISPVNAALFPYFSFVDERGNPNPLYTTYRQGYIDQLGGGRLLDWKYYPLTDYLNDQTIRSSTNIAAQSGVDFQLSGNLKFGLAYRFQKESSRSDNVSTLQSFNARNLINNYTQIAANGVLTSRIPMGEILNWRQQSLTGHNLRSQLSWSPQWHKNRIDAIVGAEGSSLQSRGQQDRYYGYNRETLLSAQIDAVTRFPLLATGSTAVIPKNTDFSLTNTRFLSFYTNASYSYDQRYTISGSVRRDASNLFGVLTNDKWNPLWSIGGLWNVTNEHFWKWKAVNRLNVRATYGLQGNLDPSKVAVTTLFYTLTNPYLQSPVARIANYPNPELKWEQVSQTNLGLDFDLLDSKIGGSIEWFHKKLSNMYTQVPIDYTTGVGTGAALRNVGEGVGNGLDVQLRTSYQISTVKVQHDLIINYYKDKVKKLNEPPSMAINALSNGVTPLEGFPATALFAYQWAGLDPTNGNPRGYLNGVITSNWNNIIAETAFTDARYMGNLLPSYTGSFGTTLDWKGLSFTFRLTYKWDYVFRRSSIAYGDLVTRLQGHQDYGLRWQTTGDELRTNVPSFSYPVNNDRDNFYRFSEILVEKGNHIRLQWVNLAYSLPASLSQYIHTKKIAVFANGNNLGMLYKANKQGLDPEYLELPNSSTYTFGLRVGL